MGLRWGERFERSAWKEEELLSMVSRGLRASFSMFMRSPRCDGVERKVLKADWSSADAVRHKLLEFCEQAKEKHMRVG